MNCLLRNFNLKYLVYALFPLFLSCDKDPTIPEEVQEPLLCTENSIPSDWERGYLAEGYYISYPNDTNLHVQLDLPDNSGPKLLHLNNNDYEIYFGACDVILHVDDGCPLYYLLDPRDSIEFSIRNPVMRGFVPPSIEVGDGLEEILLCQDRNILGAFYYTYRTDHKAYVGRLYLEKNETGVMYLAADTFFDEEYYDTMLKYIYSISID